MTTNMNSSRPTSRWTDDHLPTARISAPCCRCGRYDEPVHVVGEEFYCPDCCPCRPLPTTAEMTGSDPDFTGDMTTEEYIAAIRRNAK